MLEAVSHADMTEPVREKRQGAFRRFVEHVGDSTFKAFHEAHDLIAFFGRLVITIGQIIRDPRRLRLTSLSFHIEQIGVNALPILGLLSFLIGVVMAFQGADQLHRLGADLYVVNLLGISILRELGILITAIIVAGRTGSAFTAQIGSMKVNEEIDALETLGLNPMEVLVIPRLLALVICLPLLSFYACIIALIGGAVMSFVKLGITFGPFLRQLESAVNFNTFAVGQVKAPVFAFIIAMVGCYEGFRVEGNAESVGRLTTSSVVVSIFLVIVTDALFSVLFSILGV